MSIQEKNWQRCKMGLLLELDPSIVNDVKNVVEALVKQQVLKALEEVKSKMNDAHVDTAIEEIERKFK